MNRSSRIKHAWKKLWPQPYPTVAVMAEAHWSVPLAMARKSIRKLSQQVIPALLVTSSIFVIRQVLVTKSHEGVLALFLKVTVTSDSRPRVWSDIHVYWTFDGRSTMVNRP